jgi:hypothetical protein
MILLPENRKIQEFDDGYLMLVVAFRILSDRKVSEVLEPAHPPNQPAPLAPLPQAAIDRVW